MKGLYRCWRNLGMDEFDRKVIVEYVSPRFETWKEFLTPTEQAIFKEYYYFGFSIVKIAQLENYSEIQVKRILKKARNKIYKHLP